MSVSESTYFSPRHYFAESNSSLDIYNNRNEFIPYRRKDKFGLKLYNIYCRLKGFSYLTKDIFWKAHRMNKDLCFSVEGMLPKDKVAENCRRLNALIWHYNRDCQSRIDKIVEKCNIENEYVSFHIRRGDKVIEADNSPLDIYIKKAESITSLRTAFVFTDDYSVIFELRNLYPKWLFYTICPESDKGYFHGNFTKESKDVIYNRIIYLFANIELMSKSKYFIGTMSSNVGMYMYWRMPKGHCLGVDFDEWVIW